MTNTTLPHDYEVHQEEDLLPVKPLVRVYLTSILVGAIGVFFGGVILAAATGALRPDVSGPRGQRAAPDQISHVEETLVWNTRRGLDLREKQRAELQNWGWVDRKAGLAIIPIDEAIDIVVKQDGAAR